jgi:hypothetical protein
MVDEWDQWDLMVTNRQPGYITGDRTGIDLETYHQDLATVSGQANLAQALLNRLHTRRGELAALGHPEYGSRLYQLLGGLNNPRMRLLAELYIRECLAQEPRISTVVEVRFDPLSRDRERHALRAVITVHPQGDRSPLSFNWSLYLGE